MIKKLVNGTGVFYIVFLKKKIFLFFYFKLIFFNIFKLF